MQCNGPLATSRRERDLYISPIIGNPANVIRPYAFHNGVTTKGAGHEESTDSEGWRRAVSMIISTNYPRGLCKEANALRRIDRLT
jgi:hypothetical protein